ncbi:MAG: ribosome maturation factor RimM [Saprospiraceae bacterium]|nr:ribosome maturation factor RimM [Saprospiraceae bacterium]
MAKTSLQEVGKLGKTFGFDGTLKVKIEGSYLAQLQAAEFVFIETAGNKLPYFLEKITQDSSTTIKFEDINSKEEAQVIAGQKLYLELVAEEVKGPLGMTEINHWTDLVGFQLEDEKVGTLGVIQEIYELPQQWMASIDYKGEEVLIPLNETFVKGIDPTEKVVVTVLPEGLLEL